MSSLFGSFRKKTISLALAGTDIPFYLLDDTQIVLKIAPATTAAAACLAIRNHLELAQDAYYSLYEFADGMFRLIEDTMQIGKIITKWPQENAHGPRRLYFKRAIYIPKSPSETEELASTVFDTGPHYLSFIDAMYHYLHGFYRFEPTTAAVYGGNLLAAFRGSYKPERDTPELIRRYVLDLVPLYALKGSVLPDSSSPRWHGLKSVDGALGSEAMAEAIIAAYKKIGQVSVLQAQKMFIKRCKENVAYGCEFFTGKRTFKEVAGGASQRSEDVTIAVGHEGIVLLGVDKPLAVELSLFESIGKWTVSRDGKIFAYSLEDERIVYIVTDSAGSIEKTVERFVQEQVRARSDRGDDKWPKPRTATGVGVTGLNTFVQHVASHAPAYALPADAISVAASPKATAAGAGVDLTPAKDTKDAGSKDGAASTHPVPAPPSRGKIEKLPPGWVTVTDDEGDVYYWNENTDETSWTPPNPDGTVPKSSFDRSSDKPRTASMSSTGSHLPPGWTSAVDDESGQTYYYHEASGETSWTRPSGEVTRARKKQLEAGLPANWHVEFDDEGDPFYVNSVTNATSWSRPNPDGTLSK